MQRLSRQEISDAVADLGWRLILGTVRTHVVTGSLAEGAEFAGRVAALPDAEGHVLLDIRDDRVVALWTRSSTRSSRGLRCGSSRWTPRGRSATAHFDVSVPHDEAARQMTAALEACGTIVYPPKCGDGK